MGTVGISFGSPTAGTGFDVSSTVSQIVANLQNVETPWKTQLTALQSQDTAISSLGSLLSTLSTDISGFTNFPGRSGGQARLELRPHCTGSDLRFDKRRSRHP